MSLDEKKIPYGKMCYVRSYSNQSISIYQSIFSHHHQEHIKTAISKGHFTPNGSRTLLAKVFCFQEISIKDS